MGVAAGILKRDEEELLEVRLASGSLCLRLVEECREHFDEIQQDFFLYFYSYTIRQLNSS